MHEHTHSDCDIHWIYTLPVFTRTYTHTLCVALFSQPYIHHWLFFSEPISKWLSLCCLLLQQEGRRRGHNRPTEKGKETLQGVCVRVCFFVCAQYSDVDLLTVRQTGELCHAARTNGRQRNGAMSDITAGIGRELSAWNCSPLKRQTGWAANVTLIIIKNRFASFFFSVYPSVLSVCRDTYISRATTSHSQWTQDTQITTSSLCYCNCIQSIKIHMQLFCTWKQRADNWHCIVHLFPFESFHFPGL